MLERDYVRQEPNSPTIQRLAHQLYTIHNFLESFPADEIQSRCWNLLFAAFSSDNASEWSTSERSDMMFFYEKICKLAPALAEVDRELVPLYVSKEY